jgi:hypothetical protein
MYSNTNFVVAGGDGHSSKDRRTNEKCSGESPCHTERANEEKKTSFHIHAYPTVQVCVKRDAGVSRSIWGGCMVAACTATPDAATDSATDARALRFQSQTTATQVAISEGPTASDFQERHSRDLQRLVEGENNGISPLDPPPRKIQVKLRSNTSMHSSLKPHAFSLDQLQRT